MSRKRRIGATLLALLLAALTICGAASPAYAAGDPEGYIVMSVEKLTLGQGYILEPQRFPYYKDETLAQVLDRALHQAGRDYMSTGSLTSGFYLSAVQDVNRPPITVPDYIQGMWQALSSAAAGTKPIATEDTIDRDFLGQFDYFSHSGWMYSVNDSFPPVGAADVTASDGLVVRWQFTLIGYGGDLGGGGQTAAGSTRHMNRTELYTVMAAVRDDPVLLRDQKVRSAYESAMELSRDITVEKDALQTYLDVMKNALGDNQITELTFSGYESGSRSYESGVTLDAVLAELPDYLMAVVSGREKIITGITWELVGSDNGFGPPATYQFRPMLPPLYDNYTLTAELPMMQVTIRPPTGDVNSDAVLDVRDVSRLAASAGRTDRPLCDLDGSGMVSWNDLRALLALLGPQALDTPDGPDTALAVVFDKSSYAVGDTATARIYAPEAAFDTYSIHLTYDPQRLAFREITLPAPFLTTATVEAEGSLRLGGASLEGAKQCDTAVTVTFEVLAAGPASAQTVPEDTALLTSGYYLDVPAANMALLTARPAVCWGDMNGDGQLDETDIRCVIDGYNDDLLLTQEQQVLADVDGDGVIGFRDIMLLIRRYNGLPDAFPVETEHQEFVIGGE